MSTTSCYTAITSSRCDTPFPLRPDPLPASLEEAWNVIHPIFQRILFSLPCQEYREEPELNDFYAKDGPPLLVARLSVSGVRHWAHGCRDAPAKDILFSFCNMFEPP